MAEYTPTDGEIRAMANSYDGVPNDVFDRWLAGVKRQAKAEALEEFAEKWAVQNGIEALMFARDDVSAVQLTEAALIARAAEYRNTAETGDAHG